jgi:hypothetical protein
VSGKSIQGDINGNINGRRFRRPLSICDAMSDRRHLVRPLDMNGL